MQFTNTGLSTLLSVFNYTAFTTLLKMSAMIDWKHSNSFSNASSHLDFILFFQNLNSEHSGWMKKSAAGVCMCACACACAGVCMCGWKCQPASMHLQAELNASSTRGQHLSTLKSSFSVVNENPTKPPQQRKVNAFAYHALPRTYSCKESSCFFFPLWKLRISQAMLSPQFQLDCVQYYIAIFTVERT